MLPTVRAMTTTQCVNPVIVATRNVFEMMLECTPRRTGLWLKEGEASDHAVSAVIGVTGEASGTIVVSFSREVAIEVLRRMVGTVAESVNREVCDAVGELTNMIAGGAKSQLTNLNLSISIPNIVTGTNHSVLYPSDIQPICIRFESDIGPFTIEVGFSFAA